MEERTLSRESAEYAAILSEVFAAFVKGSLGSGIADPELALTPALADSLQFLYLHGVSSVGRIAEGLGISEPGASQLVERLARLDLVTRTEDERDRRMARVILTERGREAASRNRAARQQSFADVFGRLDARNRKSFMEGLEAFLAKAVGDEEDIAKFCARCGIDHVAFCVLNRIHQVMTGSQMEDF